MQPTAQAVGWRYETIFKAPKGRQRLSPDVFLVVGHIVLLGKCGKLFLNECFLWCSSWLAIYLVTAATYDSLTLNTPYPVCQEKSRLHSSRTHPDEFALITRASSVAD